MEPPKDGSGGVTLVTHHDSAAADDAAALAALLDRPEVIAYQQKLEAEGRLRQPELGNEVMRFAAALPPLQAEA